MMAESPASEQGWGSARLGVSKFSCRVLTLGRLSPCLDQHETTTAADNVHSSRVTKRQKAAENMHTKTFFDSILRQSL